MYAQGKKALGLCDRCGFTYKLNTLKYEIVDSKRNGLRVCNECFDQDQPQLKLGNINTSDNQALFDPRVDTGKQSSTSYFGSKILNSLGITATLGTITLSGVSNSPTPSPTPAPTTTVTGVVGTKGLGALTATGIYSATTYTVIVASYSGANYFYIDSSRAATLSLT